MAGDVVNWTFYLASTFVVYWQFCAPKSATAPSAKPLCAIERSKPDKKPKIYSGILVIKTENKIRLILGQALQEDLLKMHFQSEDA